VTAAERQQLRSIGLSDKAIDTLESMGCEIVGQTAATPANSTGGGAGPMTPPPISSPSTTFST